MIILLIGIVLVGIGCGWARWQLSSRERDVDYERDYQAPMTIGAMPNVPPA